MIDIQSGAVSMGGMLVLGNCVVIITVIIMLIRLLLQNKSLLSIMFSSG